MRTAATPQSWGPPVRHPALRHVAGGTPKVRLNARLKAASEAYPTWFFCAHNDRLVRLLSIGYRG
jgi:hypothetical protein